MNGHLRPNTRRRQKMKCPEDSFQSSVYWCSALGSAAFFMTVRRGGTTATTCISKPAPTWDVWADFRLPGSAFVLCAAVTGRIGFGTAVIMRTLSSVDAAARLSGRPCDLTVWPRKREKKIRLYSLDSWANVAGIIARKSMEKQQRPFQISDKLPLKYNHTAIPEGTPLWGREYIL